MKEFFNKTLTLLLFLLSAGLFYLTFTYVFISSFINIALFIIAIFVLLEACGNIDKANGYGKYSGTTSSDSSKREEDEQS